MMGHRQVEQAALFYEFSLDRHIPPDHLLRAIDRFVELGELRRELTAFYSRIGRPSIDPELMIRMLLIGYCFGIRSERRLCEEVHLNLAYRWFCRLGLDEAVPDHSTFSKNRHGRFRRERSLQAPVRDCVAPLHPGAAGRLIKADANRQKGMEGDKGLPPEAAGRAIEEFWPFSTMPLSGRRPRSRRSSCRLRILRHAGPVLTADKPSSRTRRTI
jgi:transposase